MPTAAIYTRYSSDHQTEDSIEAQKRACEDYAASHGLAVVSFYADRAVSGKNDKRPEFQKMIRDAEAGKFSVVLVHKYNRFARRMTDHVKYEDRLNQAGCDLIAVAEDFGTGKEAIIMKALMRSLSEYYLADLSSEVKKGHKETALKGLHNGGYAPFGYDVVDQKYVVNPLEAGYVRKIFDAAINREGFTELLHEMQSSGITGKRGRPIRYTQIYEILRNEKYTGTYTYSPEEEKNRSDRRGKPNAIKIENAFPAIITKAQFMEVQKIMDARKQTGKKAGYLCSGLVYCKCGAKMHGHTAKRKGHEYKYFVCSKKCGFGTVSMNEVDDLALSYLHNLLSPENQDTITASLRRYQAGAGSRMDEFKQVLRQQIQTKQREYDTLLKNLSTGALPQEVVADIGRRMQQIKEEIETLKNTEPPKDFTVEQIKAWLEAIKKAPDERAIHLLIERIDVTQKEPKTDFNVASTLKSVLGEHGCGGRQHSFPEILFSYSSKGLRTRQ